MPAKRVPMRQIRELLRFKHACGMSNRQIGDALGMGRTTVGDYLRRLAFVGIGWPVPAALDDAALEACLLEQLTDKGGRREPDWAMVHRELKRPGVSQRLLWGGISGDRAKRHSLSRFCELYGAWGGRLSSVMRQHHVAGEKLFVAI